MTETTEIVAADIGGTHARFAIAEVAGGRVLRLGPEATVRAADHASLQIAWQSWAATLGRPLPRAAAIALATPISGDVLKMTNNPWIIRPALIPEKLGVDRYVLVNDFEAVAHAVAQLDPAGADSGFRHLCGPDAALPDTGVITILGPGTGMGVAQLHRIGGSYHVIATEGGHIDFAPLDSIEDAILAHLRRRHVRVSAERIVSGPGLAAIHEVLAAIEGRAILAGDDKALWTAALAGSDSLAAAALDRFCLALGSFAGDIALAQGAAAVVIAGGVGARIADHLPASGFAERFRAKGRFHALMDRMPVKLVSHPQPGLYGAAAAFAQRNPQ
ncbi:glucokinase [Polymorphobacter fuscus]|uniref:Glucokinase n=1 Tax=Sandarakinorhabdus fusca TaxID=1439888 RepID=A0A7C9KHG6_9SPHN|nr:glucokinase [Polymorphobacter fuscus]KAB7647574.1 glucokinase [Polymorphobacter fuscus]MQT16840.1 glucokinase [Polymorphobacter fuscus]NJC09171.1 glucokinase [Polymorphobacter fuscus]